MTKRLALVALSFLFFVVFAKAQEFAEDFHSYAEPNKVVVRHVDLDWQVNFSSKIITGFATLTLERFDKSAPLMLDTRDLQIKDVLVSKDGKIFKKTTFSLGTPDKILGAPLKVDLASDTKFVRVYYSTSPNASGLQWLTPEQTADKRYPFMYSQAQAIHARSFIPLQDSPQIRITYSAKVRTPRNLLAVMSAEGNLENSKRRGGLYTFKMTKPIPPYLIAIAVGELGFRPLGKRCGVFAEPSVLEKAASEFSDTEKMMEAAERLYGPYRWGRYDILVLPPSFPFGGMENPMLTFATPTILAGDKSLVSVIAHELAHSWSGNLVTNATWRDFWLNEGFTTYIERRIIEVLYGENRREMEAMLGKQGLLRELSSLPPSDQILHVDLKGRDPDDAFTGVPYEKGALFLRWLEEKFGREKFDKFLRSYFDSHAFKSITTETFVSYLQKNLLEVYPGVVSMAEIEEWIEKAGLPKNAPSPYSENFAKVETDARKYLNGEITASEINAKDWTTQEWLKFLDVFSEGLTAERMKELDLRFNLTKTGNSEIAFQWLMLAIRSNYREAYGRLEDFLMNIGRRKFVRPLYVELARTPEGKEFAQRIYAKARNRYHPITQATIDAILASQ
ncbi:MAG: M1 family peptidase [Acidobacteria bacterium]|jgi:leukotriene A-4 hydrolase/aminopeptidase|nr:MAG: M1 family peptidase [Acidobacteriota bacterium]GIU81893.1 MAG: aminopeptidase [Pyrinomonadaceae bacterium]